MNVAVILAGGSGTRLGADLPKQFIKVFGKSILQHTVEVFHHSPLIDEIAIVARPDTIVLVENMVQENNLNKVKHVLAGGKERHDSSLSALNVYTSPEDKLLFHDAVRPLVNERIISDCITALDSFQAVETAIPATDTIIQVDSSGCLQNIPPRSLLRNVQTPQGFIRQTIADAYQKALSDPSFTTTDDCGVVHHYLPEVPIHIVQGDVTNIKITYSHDLKFMELILNQKER